MGGSEAKPISAQPHSFLLQYPSACPWDDVDRATRTLRACFPNATVASYRTAAGGEVEVFAGATRSSQRVRVFAAAQLGEDSEREIVQAIKNALKL